MAPSKSLLAICAFDRPESASIRDQNRAEHLAYVATHLDRLKLAGPLLGEDGRVCGSLIVVAMSRSEAKQFSAQDPYRLAGLFEMVRITAFSPVVGPLASTG